ncbi:MAG: ATP-binding protein [Oscillospiraceae bacterium]
MAASIDAIDSARAELSARHANAEEENRRRIDEINRTAPEITALSKKLFETNAQIVRAILSRERDVNNAIADIRHENEMFRRMMTELLRDFGYPADYLEVHYTCAVCGDTGYREGVRCQCFEELIKAHEMRRLNRSCRIQLRDFAEFRLDVYPENRAGINVRERMEWVLEQCRYYAEHFTPQSDSLLMLGGTGLGKTFLSSAIAKRLLERGVRVAFDSVQNFLRDIENSHFGRSDNNTLELLLSCDLLIIDDLGAEFCTSFSQSALYNLLNTRINEGKPTIVSTNLNLEELSGIYNERMISRLTGMFKPVLFLGNDVRQQLRRDMAGK